MTNSVDDAKVGEAILQLALQEARHLFGPRLLASYALGSLAHGGFCPAVSDVDLALVLADPLSDADATAIETLTRSIRARPERLADRLSVFWGSAATLSGNVAGGRFPPVDLADLRQYGRLLEGCDIRHAVREPSRSELIVAAADLALARFAGAEPLAQCRDPAPLVAAGARALTKRVLFPVRFLYTARTGRIGLNAEAVADFLATHAGPAARLVQQAFAWRSQPFASNHPDVLAQARAGLRPLYRLFVAEYLPWLESAGGAAQADAFRAWGARLG